MTVIKNPALFISKASGLALPADATSAKISPTQMAKGASEKEIEGTAGTSKTAMFAIVILQIAC